jgi:2'-5' RNA ligase
MAYSYSCDKLDPTAKKNYAVVIYLPEEMEQTVAPLRERFDPDYNLIAAHVTLVFPFETDRPLNELTRVIHGATFDMDPLAIELSSIDDFYPRSPIIFWKVKETPELHHLYKQLYAGLDLSLPHKRFLPHVTVGREISHHRLVLVKDEIAAYLPNERFVATTVDLVSPVAGQHWVSVRSFPLGAI